MKQGNNISLESMAVRIVKSVYKSSSAVLGILKKSTVTITVTVLSEPGLGLASLWAMRLHGLSNRSMANPKDHQPSPVGKV